MTNFHSTLKVVGVSHTHSFVYLLSIFITVPPTLDDKASVKRLVSPQFLDLRQLVGLLGRVIRPSQCRYLHKNAE
jgi:hypothetical protein